MNKNKSQIALSILYIVYSYPISNIALHRNMGPLYYNRILLFVGLTLGCYGIISIVTRLFKKYE